MNLLNDWISENLLYAIGWTLVHSLWQLVIISAGLWMILQVFRKNNPAFKYNLALAALGISLLAAFGTFMYEVSSFTPTPLLERMNMSFMPTPGLEASSSHGIKAFISLCTNWIELQLPLLVNFWFLGAMLFLFRLFNSLSEVRTLRKSSTDPQDFELEKMLYRLMGKMNVSSKVVIRLTSFGTSPITFGYLKPIILLPAGLIFQLSPVQLEAIIAHELAHVKRNDYLANLIQSSLEVLFFYHPCYWWMNQTVKELRENAADDLAVSIGIAPKELAYSLAEVLNFAKQNPPEIALAAAKKRNPTLQRIKRILGHPAQTYPQNPIISIPMLLTLILSAGLMATAQQDVPVTSEKAKPLSTYANPDRNQVVDLQVLTDSDASQVVQNHAKVDTIISKGETILLMKNSKNGSHMYIQNGDTLYFDDMPELELAPMPPFPLEAMAPVMDFEMAPMPPMDFGVAPIMDFDMGDMPALDFEMGTMPAMDFMVLPPVFGLGTSVFSPKDTINMTKAERETWMKDYEKRAKEQAKVMEDWEKSMKPKMEEYESKMSEWQKTYGPKMEAFEGKMAEWQKAIEPKMMEFEKQMKAWQQAQEPVMREFEVKMKVWQEANEPKMEEFQDKMKDWEKKMQPKMEEYQRKMEIWQKENAAKIEEYQQKQEESKKKKGDTK
ncbi:beta-lactamase regulating signal transducer with metallopeptidase domain [Algoriphagus ratkowskyi]|uniref:Beta-lactamase regulating signal transducer with metallopeptidase domain n=1 Tax=Algoriphagus ratkowskyi TaxID=57028 RepID=A0A2W7RYK0_9BACT|nr:M56 family metallopeptidase [Algoriphagus ratkowskyi]PZX59659.1 beta-lactamase regulating signal transducer with metallopeptidase domain [Algoriphagus ratkowskyi]TXD78621.1 M48 family metalloprotease [Algoriphagus ratkowskyi]